MTVLVAASDDLTQRLAELLPDAIIASATVQTMVARAGRERPNVVLCATDDAMAGLHHLMELRSTNPEIRVMWPDRRAGRVWGWPGHGVSGRVTVHVPGE
jgi:hypothetical protein